MRILRSDPQILRIFPIAQYSYHLNELWDDFIQIPTRLLGISLVQIWPSLRIFLIPRTTTFYRKPKASGYSQKQICSNHFLSKTLTVNIIIIIALPTDEQMCTKLSWHLKRNTLRRKVHVLVLLKRLTSDRAWHLLSCLWAWCSVGKWGTSWSCRTRTVERVGKMSNTIHFLTASIS